MRNHWLFKDIHEASRWKTSSVKEQRTPQGKNKKKEDNNKKKEDKKKRQKNEKDKKVKNK